jgi:hypothetical protein
MLMTSFGFGLADEDVLGGTSTSGITGIVAGEGFAFFLGSLVGLFPEMLLRNEKG